MNFPDKTFRPIVIVSRPKLTIFLRAALYRSAFSPVYFSFSSFPRPTNTRKSVRDVCRPKCSVFTPKIQRRYLTHAHCSKVVSFAEPPETPKIRCSVRGKFSVRYGRPSPTNVCMRWLF